MRKPSGIIGEHIKRRFRLLANLPFFDADHPKRQDHLKRLSNRPLEGINSLYPSDVLRNCIDQQLINAAFFQLSQFCNLLMQASRYAQRNLAAVSVKINWIPDISSMSQRYL